MSLCPRWWSFLLFVLFNQFCYVQSPVVVTVVVHMDFLLIEWVTTPFPPSWNSITLESYWLVWNRKMDQLLGAIMRFKISRWVLAWVFHGVRSSFINSVWELWVKQKIKQVPSLQVVSIFPVSAVSFVFPKEGSACCDLKGLQSISQDGSFGGKYFRRCSNRW